MPEHVAVMTREVMEHLRPRPGGRYVDGTLGGGTHSEELLKASAPDGRVLSIDVDPQALKNARQRFMVYRDRWLGVEGNFRHLDEIAEKHGFTCCDGIILDLGFSSDELSSRSKGLSFKIQGPLDMRFGPKSNEDNLTAAEIINAWSREDIESVIRKYGEDRYARRIAEGIVKARKKARIITTLDLAHVISSSVPRNYERGRIHPATRTFQALRITVNDELEALKYGIERARRILASKGRIAIISFHSLEDRIVKRAFREADDLSILTKKPVTPTSQEIKQNPRSRSAKLRVAEKVT